MPVFRSHYYPTPDFAYQDGPFEFVLPTPDKAAILADHESLYRFLSKATAEAPDARFRQRTKWPSSSSECFAKRSPEHITPICSLRGCSGYRSVASSMRDSSSLFAQQSPSLQLIVAMFAVLIGMGLAARTALNYQQRTLTRSTMDATIVVAVVAIGVILFGLLLGLVSVVERTAPPEAVSGSARHI